MQHSKIPLILPAAGKSSRLGTPKGLRKHRGRFWLEIQCESFHAAGGKIILLVLGYDAEEYRKAFNIPAIEYREFVDICGCQVHVLENPLPEFGPFSSLHTACEWIAKRPMHQEAWYLPIDTPVPSAEVLAMLLEKLQPGICAVEPRLGTAGGHPVLLSREFMEHILTLDVSDPASRLDHQLQLARERREVASVPVDDLRVAMNLNDAEAWRYFEKYERYDQDAQLESEYEDFESQVDSEQQMSSLR